MKFTYQPLREPNYVEVAELDRRQCFWPFKFPTLFLVTLLVGSIGANCVFLWVLSNGPPACRRPSLSKNAGLAWTLEEIVQTNMSSTTDFWTVDLASDRGVVALDPVYQRSHNLQQSDKFPWDHTKSLYEIGAYHSLHCLVLISIKHYPHGGPRLTVAQDALRNALLEYHNDEPQSRSWDHLAHCGSTLRDDIRCFADDTLFTSGRHPRARYRAQRVCRDLGQLDQWSDSHNACWKLPQPGAQFVTPFDPYRFCPPGSPYQAQVDAIWGP